MAKNQKEKLEAQLNYLRSIKYPSNKSKVRKDIFALPIQIVNYL